MDIYSYRTFLIGCRRVLILTEQKLTGPDKLFVQLDVPHGSLVIMSVSQMDRTIVRLNQIRVVEATLQIGFHIHPPGPCFAPIVCNGETKRRAWCVAGRMV